METACCWNGTLQVHFYTARFLLSEINHRPPSERKRHTHIPFFTSKVCLCFLCCVSLFFFLYTWPSGTKAQLWLRETTNKEQSLSPRSLRNRRRGRHGTEIAKGQGGRPIVRAHLSHSLYTCMLTCSHTHMHTHWSMITSPQRDIHLQYSNAHTVAVDVCENFMDKFQLAWKGTDRERPTTLQAYENLSNYIG